MGQVTSKVFKFIENILQFFLWMITFPLLYPLSLAFSDRIMGVITYIFRGPRSSLISSG